MTPLKFPTGEVLLFYAFFWKQKHGTPKQRNARKKSIYLLSAFVTFIVYFRNGGGVPGLCAFAQSELNGLPNPVNIHLEGKKSLVAIHSSAKGLARVTYG